MKTYLLSVLIALGGATYFLACSADVDTAPVTPAKSDIQAQVNDLRRSGCQCGEEWMPPVPALDWNELLEAAALRHAKDMATHDHFDHTGTDNSSTIIRVEEAGYEWTAYGENIAHGLSTAKAVIAMWKDSESHCKNMMSPAFKEMGVAQQDGYWVQVLATSR